MKDSPSPQAGIIKVIATLIGSIVAVGAIAIAAAFLWPAQKAELRTADIKRLDYDGSMAAINRQITHDTAEAGLRNECRSFAKTHGKKTAKAILLIHGISGCTSDMADIANVFYEQGYNVYVPRVPQHGYADKKRHGQISFSDMVNYMTTSARQVSGLGEEVGVAGHSGGGNMATWLAQYGNGLFSRVLLIAPFYEPSASQAPKWQIPLMRNLYGNNILPDRYSGNDEVNGLSYRTLAKYVTLKENYKANLAAPGLKHVGVVVSEGDHDIDPDLAHDIPQKMATNNNASFQYKKFPASMNIGHDMTRRASPGVSAHSEEVFQAYLAAYEGK